MDTVSRLTLVVLLLVFSGGVFSYGLVTPSGQAPNYTGISVGLQNAAVNGGPYDAASEDLACKAAMDAQATTPSLPYRDYYNPNSPYTLSSAAGVKTAGSGCAVRRCPTAARNTGCGLYPGFVAGIATKSLPGPITCPANSSLSGSTCTCDVGFKGGSFGGTSPASSCSPYSCQAGAGPSFGSSSRSDADGFSCDSDGAQAGCVVSKEFYAGTKPDGGAYVYWSTSKYTGAACNEGGTSSSSAGTAPPAAVEPHTPTNDEKCVFGNNPPMCPGVVNGTSVCVVCGGSSKTTTETSATPAGAGSAPAGVQAGTKSTSTECSGTSCTTTTTYKDAGGTVIGTTTSSGPPSGSSFGSGGGTGTGDTLCDVYPNVAACKTGSFAGTCAAGAASIACEGDAVQCSIAREQFKRQCEFFEKTGDETAAANQAKTDGIAGASDHPNRSPETHSLSTFDQTNLIGGSCPPDRILGSGSVHVTLPFSQLCEPASTLGMILVGITALSCIAIVFKGS